jgi:hypothetical protein
MDDPSFVSSTPSAAKMGLMMPQDVSVIQNAGVNVGELRRPTSKELFASASTTTTVTKEAAEERFLRRETYVAQPPPIVEGANDDANALKKLDSEDVSKLVQDYLNFTTDDDCGDDSVFAKVVEEEMISTVTTEVVTVEEGTVVTEEYYVTNAAGEIVEVDDENVSLLVRNYLENSDKCAGSGRSSTLTRTNSTAGGGGGEITAILRQSEVGASSPQIEEVNSKFVKRTVNASRDYWAAKQVVILKNSTDPRSQEYFQH